MPAVAQVPIDSLLALLMAALLVAVIVRFVNLPYTVALVVVGLGLGVSHLMPSVALTSDTILRVFLPALLFQAAIGLRLDVFRQAAGTIALLAVVGVAGSVLVVGSLFARVTGVGIGVAFVFASMVSATDPVAVLAIFKKLGVPHRLEMVVEGESLFNDGTALVIFGVALMAAEGHQIDAWSVLGTFSVTVLGGIVVGAGTGFGMSHLMRLSSDHLVETGLSTVLAYGTFLLGDAVHVSPVIAVVVAGLVLANYGREIGLSTRAQVVLGDIWEYVAFLMNSLLFLLIGMQIHLDSLQSFGLAITAAIVLVVLSRAGVVYGLSALMARFSRPLPFKWQHIMMLGGLRGAVTVAMALSLPLDLPQHDLVVAVTFSVVLFTILSQGLTVEWVVSRLGLRHTE